MQLYRHCAERGCSFGTSDDLLAIRVWSVERRTVPLTLLLSASRFDGKMVAKLPFTPFAIFRPLSHRNLPGEDFTDCSMVRTTYSLVALLAGRVL